MQLTERRIGEVVIIAVNGDVTADQGGGGVLSDKIRSLIQQGHLKLLIDLGQVSYVDSSGLGQLVRSYATTRNAGGALKLLRLTKRLKDLLTITKLVTVFDSFDDETAAIASF